MTNQYHRENALTALAKASEAMGNNAEGLRHLADLKRLIDAPPSPSPWTPIREASTSVSGKGRNASIPARMLCPPPADRTRDWNAIDAAIDEYLDGYELRLDEGCHTPTEFVGS